MRFGRHVCCLAILLLSASTLGCGQSITAREARARQHPDQRAPVRDTVPRPPSSRASTIPLRDLALSATGLREPRRGIVEVALAMIGSSSKGIDCSSFSQQVYATSGQRLPRTVSEQLASGNPVSTGEMQPGDLVFFAFKKRPADHVGIYAGDGAFVHVSSAASGVRVESLHESVFSHAFVASRRYVQ